jgi:hypothetical protein
MPKTIRTELAMGMPFSFGNLPFRSEPIPGTCPMCEASIPPAKRLCDPCQAWSDAGCPKPIPPHICNTVARIFGFPETY